MKYLFEEAHQWGNMSKLRAVKKGLLLRRLPRDEPVLTYQAVTVNFRNGSPDLDVDMWLSSGSSGEI